MLVFSHFDLPSMHQINYNGGTTQINATGKILHTLAKENSCVDSSFQTSLNKLHICTLLYLICDHFYLFNT